ncbi:AbrB/MazE/SpoVT family DNA-binding domain-containing protein [Paenibacillus elgii]|nr:AbrB/MazE/SpoVT family DNA-binding domain-containing protein [Paenibacillus elgii]MCM3268779.1 AbrB/MazE/SpoVT family DNA-binding domain-containing protein [Paenibacillus elgii]
MRMGIVRELDRLGRIVIPIEVRRLMNITENQSLEVLFDEEKKRIAYRKYRAAECLFCNGTQQLKVFKGYYVCQGCIDNLPVPQIKEQQIELNTLCSDHSTVNKSNPRLSATLKRLRKAIKENPTASQVKLARMLGTSQTRISQLIRNYMQS